MSQPIMFLVILQEEELQFSEREKQTVQQQLRMKVNNYIIIRASVDALCRDGEDER